MTMIKSNSATF